MVFIGFGIGLLGVEIIPFLVSLIKGTIYFPFCVVKYNFSIQFCFQM